MVKDSVLRFPTATTSLTLLFLRAEPTQTVQTTARGGGISDSSAIKNASVLSNVSADYVFRITNTIRSNKNVSKEVIKSDNDNFRNLSNPPNPHLLRQQLLDFDSDLVSICGANLSESDGDFGPIDEVPIDEEEEPSEVDKEPDETEQLLLNILKRCHYLFTINNISIQVHYYLISIRFARCNLYLYVCRHR